MTGTIAIKETGNMGDIRWTPMLTLSFAIHLGVFLMILFMPDFYDSGRHIPGEIYEVDIVEIPEDILEKETPKASPTNRSNSVSKREPSAKRISVPASEKKPRPITKRTVDKKKAEAAKPEETSSQIIDRAISGIEKKVQSQSADSSYIDRAISKLENSVTASDSKSGKSGAPSEGIIMRLYQSRVYSWIKSNWTYPVDAGNRTTIEAVVNLKVKKDGTIIESRFTKKSGNTIFDQSVMKAVEKSDPLPGFPEGYRKSYEEFEIKFNLNDLYEN